MSREIHIDMSSLEQWAGSSRPILAVVFTDLVGSTNIMNQLGNEKMDDIRQQHFIQARNLIEKYNGFEIKTIGDSFLATFHSAIDALDFSLDLYSSPGDNLLRIRAGIHVGLMHISEKDVFGASVNFASRVIKCAKDAEIWISKAAKEQIDQEKMERHSALEWIPHPMCELKGFPERHDLWSLCPSRITDGLFEKIQHDIFKILADKRNLRIIKVFLTKGPLTFNEIVKETHLNEAQMKDLLINLIDCKLLTANDGQFYITRLCSLILETLNDIKSELENPGFVE